MSANVASPVQSCGNKKDEAEKQDPEKKWIKFSVKDDSGKPVAHVRLFVFLPDDSCAEVITDSNGEAEIKNIEPGNCEVELNYRVTTVENAVFFSG
jgi:protocatechuate 3,4-dioxygenase beta subunit